MTDNYKFILIYSNNNNSIKINLELKILNGIKFNDFVLFINIKDALKLNIGHDLKKLPALYIPDLDEYYYDEYIFLLFPVIDKSYIINHAFKIKDNDTIYKLTYYDVNNEIKITRESGRLDNNGTFFPIIENNTKYVSLPSVGTMIELKNSNSLISHPSGKIPSECLIILKHNRENTIINNNNSKFIISEPQKFEESMEFRSEPQKFVSEENPIFKPQKSIPQISNNYILEDLDRSQLSKELPQQQNNNFNNEMFSTKIGNVSLRELMEELNN